MEQPKRIRVIKGGRAAQQPQQQAAAEPAAAAPSRWRGSRIWEAREARDCVLMHRAALRVERPLAGSLLLEDGTSTIYVPPGWTARHDASGNLVIAHAEAST